jgi:hypothetical protein
MRTMDQLARDSFVDSCCWDKKIVPLNFAAKRFPAIAARYRKNASLDKITVKYRPVDRGFSFVFERIIHGCITWNIAAEMHFSFSSHSSWPTDWYLEIGRG